MPSVTKVDVCRSMTIGVARPVDLPSPDEVFKSMVKVLSTPSVSWICLSSPNALRSSISTAEANSSPVYTPGGTSIETGPLPSTSTKRKSLPQNVPGIGFATSVRVWYSIVLLNCIGSVTISIVLPSPRYVSRPSPVSFAGVDF